MKILIILVWIISFSYAGHISWMGAYDKALQKAQTEHKPLMVLLVKKGCIGCQDVIKTYFMNQPYIKSLNQKVVSVIVTYEGRTSYPIELFYTTVFPTVFFVDTQTETFLTAPFYGKINLDRLKQIIQNF